MKIILISGKAGAGKDTVGEIMEAILTDTYHKRVLITHFGDPVKFVAEKFFGWNGEKDAAGRTLLQTVGENTRKTDPEFWAHFIAVLLHTFVDVWDYVLIPDFRHGNEFKALWWEKTLPEPFTVRVNAQTCRREMTKEQLTNPSETELDWYDFDYTVENNGTMAELYAETSAVLAEIVKA